ncbi:MAG: sigma-70 family RNA polymerase sigma factor [Actinobacteria bacterium]|nr:sigma-70 family RNA polymerase sigma factor [Actinomycetota bacterium]
MLRLARVYGLGVDAAEDVVQEAWLRALNSLSRFEGRSSFRTWLFVILGNCARGRSAAERRSVPVAAFAGEGSPAVDESRFFSAQHPRWAGMWTTLVDSWETLPDERLLAGEARERFRQAIDELPARYATVFVLRDVEGWSSDEVCLVLDLSPENQRVLLHRARGRLRSALEEYLGSDRA